MRRFKLDTPPNIPKRLDDLENRINWLDMARFENIRAYDDADPPALIGVAAAISEGDGMNITRLTSAPMPRFELAPFLYYDFIVESGGIGTHTTLTSAIAAAITAGGTQTIWLAESVTEATIDIGGLASGQRIVIVASDRNKVTITAATNSDIFDQTSAGAGALEFHNVGFSITSTNFAILFVDTSSEVTTVHFDRCRFTGGTGGYLLRQTGGTNGLGSIHLQVINCVGDLEGFYRTPTISSGGPDIISAYNNILTMDNWWDGGSSNVAPDNTRIQGGYYNLGTSSGITFPNGAGDHHFQDLILEYNASGALFITGASSTSINDLSFQNIVIRFDNTNGTFGNFGSNNSSVNTGLYVKNIFGHGSATGTFLTVDSDWTNVHVGNLLARGFSTTYSGPAGVGEDHGLLAGLSDDDHTQYALLAGRSGGQTLIGGTASGDDLTLQSTSNATRGSIFLGSSGTFEFDEQLAHLNVIGEVDLVHTAAENDEHALEIDVIAGGFDDIKAIDIQYTTGALAAGEDDEAVLVDLDEDAASGGRFSAFEMLTTTTGGVKVEGLFAGAGVAPIEQLSGTFDDPDLATIEGVDKLTDLVNPVTNVNIFETDTDVMIIGNVVKFEELEFILSTGSSGAGIKPKFEFSSGAGPAWTEFGPTDGTNGMRNTGIIVWEDSDIPSWVSVGGNFQIRITRQRSTLTTEPVCSFLQLAVTVEFSWNKDGDILANTLSAGDTLLQLGLVGAVPTLTFDTNDRIEYNRSTNIMSFYAAGLLQAQIFNVGTISVGVDASRVGRFQARGAGGSSTVGGKLELYSAADHDGTFDFWGLYTVSDDLHIFSSDNAVINVFTAEGQLQLPTQGSGGGLLLRGDAQLYRSAADTLRTPDSMIIDGTLTVSGASLQSVLYNFGGGDTTLTIATGDVTATRSYHTIAGQSGVDDDLVGINGGSDGDLLLIRPSSDSVTITVKHNGSAAAADNILLNGDTDAILDDEDDCLLLMYDAGLDTNGAWIEVTRGPAQAPAAHDILSSSHGDTLAAGVTDGSIVIGNVTPAWSELVISIPAANVRNVLGIDNGELRPSWKTALDATNPAAIGTAGPGTSLVFSHRDHVHAAAATDVTYAPAVDADWDGDADPGDVDDALDQLAERVDDLETVTLWWAKADFALASQTNRATYPVTQITSIELMHISGAVPDDFASVTEVLLILSPDATEMVTVDFLISSNAPGELNTFNEAENLNETQDMVVNVINEWDITSLLPTVSAGDYMGFRISSDTSNIYVIGIRFKYNRLS